MSLTQPKIDLREQATILCERCGGHYFKEVNILKKVSRLLTGAPEDTIVPFPVYRCDDCGHINDGFNPFEEPKKEYEFQDTSTPIKKG
jgi:predicted nucleic acid-binding Zn ribbon protein